MNARHQVLGLAEIGGRWRNRWPVLRQDFSDVAAAGGGP